MPHLIADLNEQPAHRALKSLGANHDAIVTAAMQASETLRNAADGWGIQAKRLIVALPDGGRQPLTEVITQMATVERLLDALRWVVEQDPNAVVDICNPTTSSGMLRETKGPDLEARWADMTYKFEVSDVIQPRNNAGKLDKDFESLGFKRDAAPPADGAVRILVVSEEWAPWLRKWKRRPWEARGVQLPQADDIIWPVGRWRTGLVRLNPLQRG